jgi:glycine betaine/proline transport system substrate-binding protein
MLAELDRATKNGDPVVVTLWRPHWAYSAYDIKDLEDPKGALGKAEEIHTIARAGFSEDFPDVAKWLEGFTMDDQQLGSLEELVINEYGQGKEAEAVDEWVKDNQQFFDQLTSS